MQSIGARQGVLSFGYFRLDKQTKVTRTSVRNPKPKTTHHRLKPNDVQAKPAQTDRRTANASGRQDTLSRNDRLDMPSRPIRRQIVRRLQIDPELRRCGERLGQQPGRIRRNTPFAANNLVHALNRNTQMSRQRLLAQSKRFEKFVQQDHAGMRCDASLRRHDFAIRGRCSTVERLLRSPNSVQRQISQKTTRGHENHSHHDFHNQGSNISAILLSILKCGAQHANAMDISATIPPIKKYYGAASRLVRSQPTRLMPVTTIIPSQSLRYDSCSFSAFKSCRPHKPRHGSRAYHCLDVGNVRRAVRSINAGNSGRHT